MVLIWDSIIFPKICCGTSSKKSFFLSHVTFFNENGWKFKQKSWTKSVDGKDHKFLWVEECLISKAFVWKVVPARLTFSVVTGICEPCVNYCAINSEN